MSKIHPSNFSSGIFFLVEEILLAFSLRKILGMYDNKALMELLGIKDRYLKRLRDNGLLGYSRYGDKYWYTQADVDRFLSQCHYAPFGNDSMNREF